MDKKELDIVVELRKDARKNISKISHEIGMPISTVHDRMKRLKKELVNKYTCIIDFKKIGFSTRAHVALRLAKREEREEVKEYLMKNQNVNSLYKINNGYDFLTEVVFRDLAELDKFIEDIEDRFRLREKKIYYIIDEIARERFLSDQIHAGLLEV